MYSNELILELVGLFSNYSITQSFYKSNNTMSTKFYVKFDGEEGEDLDNVTRELFFPFGMLLASNIGKEQASHVLLLR